MTITSVVLCGRILALLPMDFKVFAQSLSLLLSPSVSDIFISESISLNTIQISAGTELVGLAASETPNPRATMPGAVKGTFWRIVRSRCRAIYNSHSEVFARL